MRIVVAPDKFKGTATAAQVAEAVAAVASERGHEVKVVPMADGGDGTLEALGGANRTSEVSGPLGDPVQAPWRISKGVAVIEMAQCSGLVLVGGAEGNDPLQATTRGTGELIAAAVARGAKRIIVGVGGSATTDGGLGAIEALGSPARLRGVEVEVASDVTTEFIDAARVFGPQKGASPAQVELLERRLALLADRYLEDFEVQVKGVAGAGAAGGLAGGLMALGASIVSGFDLIADEVGLAREIESAAMVVTGEGGLDMESFAGKVVGGVAELAAQVGARLVVVAGAADLDVLERSELAEAQVVALADRFGTEQAMADPLGCITTAFAELLDPV